MLRMSVKMAAASTIRLLLLCCFMIASTDSQKDCNFIVKTGSSVTVPLNHHKPYAGNLKWSLDQTTVFRRSKSMILIGIQDSVDDDGNLKLTNIQKNMTGTYNPEAFDEDGRAVPGLKSKTLCVYDPVPKPSLTVTCSKDKSSNEVTFTCSYNGIYTLAWFMDGKVLGTEKNKVLKRDAKKVEKNSFSCNISNPAMTVGSDPVTQTCIKSSVFPEKLWGVSIWIFVGSGAGIVLILIIIVIVCCIYAKRKKRTHKMDEEELRLGWTNEQQQQQQQHHHHQHHHHHHQPHQPHQPHQHNHAPDHHHHHQQQPAGHTGPRQTRSKPHREPRPRAPAPPNGQPQPSPRRNAEGPRPVFNNDDEQPPPLPQPRKKTPKAY